MLAGSKIRKWKICDGNNNLTNRSEPADTELGSQRRNTTPCSIRTRTGTSGTGTDQERGDGGVELCCHRLHPQLVQMVSCGASVVLQEADGRGVALERLIREGINLEGQINMLTEMERASW